jgi:hypothetical protein
MFRSIIGVPLRNDIGDQNCFLNVVIHWIYHTKKLKKFFLKADIDGGVRNNILLEVQVRGLF